MNGVTLKNVHSQQQKYHDKIKITVTWRQKSLWKEKNISQSNTSCHGNIPHDPQLFQGWMIQETFCLHCF